MCSIINCNYNASPLSRLSSICTGTSSQEQPSESVGDNSSTTPEVYLDDASTPVESLPSTCCASEVDLLSLHPDNQRSLIFVLCFAVEMLTTMRARMKQDCGGCLFSSLSQLHHSCLIRTRQEAVDRMFASSVDMINEDCVKRRLRTFAWKPDIYDDFQMPSREEFDDLMKLCRGNWIDYIFEIVSNKLDGFCHHAIQHAQR